MYVVLDILVFLKMTPKNFERCLLLEAYLAREALIQKSFVVALLILLKKNYLLLQTLHLKSLGFTIEDASLVNSVIPGADIFGPPLAGFLADKLGNFRLFMASLTFFNGASSLLLLAIPALNNTVSYILIVLYPPKGQK